MFLCVGAGATVEHAAGQHPFLMVKPAVDAGSLGPTRQLPTLWDSAAPGPFPSLQGGGYEMCAHFFTLRTMHVECKHVYRSHGRESVLQLPVSGGRLASFVSTKPVTLQLGLCHLAFWYISHHTLFGCAGEFTNSLGSICSLEVPVDPGLLPPPTATATVLEVKQCSSFLVSKPSRTFSAYLGICMLHAAAALKAAVFEVLGACKSQYVGLSNAHHNQRTLPL